MPNSDRPQDVRRLLHDIAANLVFYSGVELLSLKNSADVFGYAVRRELRARDVRMVDEACNLKESAK